jgi:FkbM family methyltransferase
VLPGIWSRFDQKGLLMQHPFTFRPATQDADIFHEVVIANTYGLPDAFKGHEVILDIGANIGAFTYAALIRGAKEVHAFEPDKNNFEVAERNLRDYMNLAHLYHAAVWRSDRNEGTISYKGYERYTACGHVNDGSQGTLVRAEPLDQIIRRITKNGRRRIDLMKIDCEGAEYPILLTSRLLHRVDCILGEFHNFDGRLTEDHPLHAVPECAKVRGYDQFTDAELIPYLRRRGFDVAVKRHELKPLLLGSFVARRPGGRLAGLAHAWNGMRQILLRRSA